VTHGSDAIDCSTTQKVVGLECRLKHRTVFASIPSLDNMLQLALDTQQKRFSAFAYPFDLGITCLQHGCPWRFSPRLLFLPFEMGDWQTFFLDSGNAFWPRSRILLSLAITYPGEGFLLDTVPFNPYQYDKKVHCRTSWYGTPGNEDQPQ
jgi:hypothetical protein